MTTEHDDFDAPAPWPAREHDLRASAGIDAQTAFLKWWPAADARIKGFRRAAEILAVAMLTGTNEDRDTVAFPWLNSWRHYIELQIKQLIAQSRRVLDQPAQRRGGHNIEQLWSELLPLIRAAHPGDSKDELKVVGRLVKQLAALDPDNQEFRYSERTDGTPTLADVHTIDIAEFHQAMVGLASFLEAVEAALDHDEDMKQQGLEEWYEQHREFEAEMHEAYGYE
jgi:hypothetical protein